MFDQQPHQLMKHNEPFQPQFKADEEENSIRSTFSSHLLSQEHVDHLFSDNYSSIYKYYQTTHGNGVIYV